MENTERGRGGGLPLSVMECELGGVKCEADGDGKVLPKVYTDVKG